MAELPSLDALRARIVGMIATPATRVAGVLQAPDRRLRTGLRRFCRTGRGAGSMTTPAPRRGLDPGGGR